MLHERLRLYAHAHEVKCGEEWKVSHWDFFCIGGRVHIMRKTKSEYNKPLSAVSWSKPTPCNGHCALWMPQMLGMPEETRLACEKLLAQYEPG